MFGKRMTLVLVAAMAVAACGGGASPGAGTTAPATKAPVTQAPGGGPGVPSVGTVNVDFGGAKFSYPIVTCVDTAQGVAVIAYKGSIQTNAVTLVMPHDSSSPSIAGVIDGAKWVLGTNAKGTLNGKSGTFSGPDALSGKAVTGDFACTN